MLPFDRISSIEYSTDTFGGGLGSVFVKSCRGGSDVFVGGGLLPLGVRFPVECSFSLPEGWLSAGGGWGFFWHLSMQVQEWQCFPCFLQVQRVVWHVDLIEQVQHLSTGSSKLVGDICSLLCWWRSFRSPVLIRLLRWVTSSTNLALSAACRG